MLVCTLNCFVGYYNMSTQQRFKSLPLVQVARVRIITTTTTTAPQNIQKCSVCLDDDVPRGNISKCAQRKYNLREWMMICENCAQNITNQELFSSITSDVCPFGPGERINENNIFF